MTNTLTGPFWIVSAERPELSPQQNARATRALRLGVSRTRLDWTGALGFWEGRAEASTVLWAGAALGGNVELTRFAKECMADFRQDAILYVGPDGAATLYLASGEAKPLGQWQEVTTDEAAGLQAYTVIDGRFYVAR